MTKSMKNGILELTSQKCSPHAPGFLVFENGHGRNVNTNLIVTREAREEIVNIAL